MKILRNFSILLILASAAGYYYYKSTPAYTLKQIKTALEERNRKKLLKYVDIEKLKLGIVSEFLENNKLSLSEESKASAKINQFSDALLDAYFMPEMIRKRTGQNTSDVKIEEIQEIACSRSLCKLELMLIHSVKRKQKKVVVVMRKQEQGWKLTKIEGLHLEIQKYLSLRR